ncbi:PREDICTED: achaete-scute homolog 3 [Nanorana parkeri]|uniref:achaete-scute homolog 3 n=1 Tax=Nanorana parkeri TaxID=125878 RepID=UPI0008549834|nr:PREDICTED: achaete-scute homolog 3 [Nanorana parkeri]
MSPGNDPLNAVQWSLSQFGVDTSTMFPFPREVTPFPLPQDLALLSYYDPARIDYYYGALYSLPAAPGGQKYGTCEEIYGPAYIRKRNERERQRVKCVNDGYAKLRHHLPREYTEKRLSKVQTLRAAMRYILRLQEALRWGDSEEAADSLQPIGKMRASDARQGRDFLQRSQR